MTPNIPQLRRANPPRSRFSRVREREKDAHEARRIQEAKDERDQLRWLQGAQGRFAVLQPYPR